MSPTSYMNNSPVIKLGQTIKKDLNLNLNGFFLDMIYYRILL